tara:strand:+ start:995 stop:1183 length:189 start_codon:yes stop_codon:yes gene_type:complete
MCRKRVSRNCTDYDGQAEHSKQAQFGCVNVAGFLDTGLLIGVVWLVGFSGFACSVTVMLSPG